ncbi:MAG: mechanosensitive ion channel family protein [Thermoplasmata archaeon]|jgi:small conductance mechanosensitive channel|nr:mechanosensitive ion channel family protein [Thermoplasmata archaeon]
MLHEEASENTHRVRTWWSTALAAAIVTFLAVAGVLLFDLVGQYGRLPSDELGYVRVGLILTLGVASVLLVGRILQGVSERFSGRRHAGLVGDIYRIIAYPLLAIVALSAVGVNGYALLAGGTFTGLVVGLASQTALANLVAGVVLVLVRPFEPGDRLTLTTSQYSVLMPSYPPKFYSQDLLIPGFTGTVQDIGLMYTAIRLDEGPIALFPNSIVILGAVIDHNLSERWVRVKYEVPPSVEPERLLAAVLDAVAQDAWVVGKKSVRVYINQATLASYVISIDALCAGNREEPPRSALYLRIMQVVAAHVPPGTSAPTAPATVPLGTASAPPGPPPGSPAANPITRI